MYSSSEGLATHSSIHGPVELSRKYCARAGGSRDADGDRHRRWAAQRQWNHSAALLEAVEHHDVDTADLAQLGDDGRRGLLGGAARPQALKRRGDPAALRAIRLQHLLDLVRMAACYSADPDGTVRLPFEPLTGRLIPEIWDRWLAWDPVRMAAERADALRGLRAVWIDAGTSDDYYLDLGAEAFRAELTRLGIGADRIRFELFDGTHAGIDWRYPEAIGWLAERLAG